MLTLDKQLPMAELLALEKHYSVEEWLEYAALCRPLVIFQEYPDITLVALSGTYLPPHERTIMNVQHRGAGENVIVASRGTAKCLGLGTQIMMADGTRKKVEDVVVGDKVMGPDSRPRMVLDTARGRSNLYRVTQTCGMSYVVNENHLLTLKKSAVAERYDSGIFSTLTAPIVKLTPIEFMGHSKYVRDCLRGYRTEVDFSAQPVRIDPYWLGLWLGDGTGTKTTVSTSDWEIADYCKQHAEILGGYASFGIAGQRGTCHTVTTSFKRTQHRGSNLLLNALRAYKLTSPKKSGNKHIPQDYISNSAEVRLALLAGIIDSDGACQNDTYNITQKNERLARDIKYLAETLGFRATMRPAAFVDRGQLYWYWRVYIAGDVWRIPVRLARKRVAKHHRRKNWLLSRLTIDSVGMGDWAGFAVDGDQLFLLEDGTVTHNSSIACGLYPTYISGVFAKRVSLVLSASGFRGGQFLLLDIGRWLKGGWDSQKLNEPFFRSSIPRTPDPLNKSNNFWQLEFDSFSRILTLPTKDHDGIRGTRAQDLYPDEANFLDKELVDRVLRPMLNVKGDMRHGGVYAQKNRVFFTSTVDYAWRPFQEAVEGARAGLQREIAAREALLAGDRARYNELEQSGIYEHAYVKFDYTDLLIRKHLTSRDGRRFEVDFPDKEIPLQRDRMGIPFTSRDEHGRMQIDGPPVEYWPTYSVDKKGIERPLRDGTVDQAGWKAEQRNILDTSTGDVYGFGTLEEATCAGDRYITPYSECSPAWQKFYADSQMDYTAPVLWECTDPCVLGVDYAPTSDFCAFVVIRLGPLAKGDYDPFKHTGLTDWSNVVWAEQHRKMTDREAADKIRQLMSRYNLIWYNDQRITDTWEACRGIGLDLRGNGTSVRDELCWISSAEIPDGEHIIYDPLDKDPRIAAFAKHERALPILDGITSSDHMNDKLVSYTKGQLEQHFLFIGKYLEESQRPAGARELYIGYEAVRTLARQLQKLRQKPTKQWRNFYMDGDTTDDQNKKDLWAAFIYAAKQMRAHIIRQRQLDTTPPPMGGKIAHRATRQGNHGRAAGSK